MNLESKIIVITGGSRGLGLALKNKLQALGATVLSASRTTGVDVTSETAVQNFTQKTILKYDRIDVWINNAGIWLPHAPVESLDVPRVRAMFDVNFFGLLHGSKAAYVQMLKQGSGTILNIITTSALSGRPFSSAYCASKFAADGFTKSLRLEASPRGIKVLSVYPGGMKTAFFDEGRPENYDDFLDPNFVAQKIVDNLISANPEEEQTIKRPD